MRNLKILTVMLFIGLFIGGNGCRKDEVGQLHDLSPHVNSRTTFDSNQSDNDYLSKRPNINKCLNLLPAESWNKEALLSAMHTYSSLLCTNPNLIENYSNPLWYGTIYKEVELKKTTITPLINEDGTVDGLFTHIESGDSSKFNIVSFDQLLSVEDIDFFNSIDSLVSERGDCCVDCRSKWKKFWARVGNTVSGWIGRLGNSGGYSDGFIYTGGGGGAGPSGSGGGGYSGGGASGSTGIVNPRGRFYACDTRLTTVKGCEDFFKNSMGYTHLNLASDPYFQEKLETCGCWYAVRGDNDNWPSMSQGEKCMSCMPTYHHSYETELHMKVLVDFLKTIKTGCNSSQELLDEINNDLHEKACKALIPPYRGIFPVAEINNIMKRLEDNNIDFTSTMTHEIFNWVKTIGPSSKNVEEIIQKFNLTANDMTNMSEDELCKKLQINQCLKSSFLKLNDDNTLHPEEKKVLDWYNNTSLIDPCSGEEINKDDILQQACTENPSGITMDAIDEALEGKDYIERTEAFKNCEFYNCIFRKLRRNAEDCESLWKVLTNPKIKTTLDIKPDSEMNGSSMFTTLSKDKKSIYLNVSNEWCNKDSRFFDSHANEVFSTAQFLHEIIHVEWLQTLIEAGYDPTGLNGYQQLWPMYRTYLKDLFLSQGGDLNNFHHYIMVNITNSIRAIATDLFYIFDGKSRGLTIDHFMMAGANGLFSTLEIENKYTEFKNLYEDLSFERNNLEPKLSLGCK